MSDEANDFLAFQARTIDTEQTANRRRGRSRLLHNGAGDLSGEPEEPNGQQGGALLFNGRDTWVESDGDITDGLDPDNTGLRTISFWFRMLGQPTAVGSTIGQHNLPTGTAEVGDAIVAMPGMRPAFIVRRDVGGAGGTIRGSWYWRGGAGELRSGVPQLGEYFTSDLLEVGVWYFVCFGWGRVLPPGFFGPPVGPTWVSRLSSETNFTYAAASGEGSLPAAVGSDNKTRLGRATPTYSMYYRGLLDELSLEVYQASGPHNTKHYAAWNEGEGMYTPDLYYASRDRVIYHFDELSGSRVHDASPLGNHMSIKSADKVNVWTAGGKVALPLTPLAEEISSTNTIRWGRSAWGRAVWE